MILRPSRSTRTYTLFPYPTLFGSVVLVPRPGGSGRCGLPGGLFGTSSSHDHSLPASKRVALGRRAAPALVPPTVSRLIPSRGCVPSRSEEHTSELQSLMRISYAVFCLKKKINNKDIDFITLS